MPRIPAFTTAEEANITVNEVFSSIETYGRRYEQGFLENLMVYIKKDETLKNFYIRYIYECECVRTIISTKAYENKPEIFTILEMTVADLKRADTIDRIASVDSTFHRLLFCAAGKEEFFKWYKLNSESLQGFLNNFWHAVGLGTSYHKELLDIHENIFKYIIEDKEELAIDTMQKHFSILLLKLLGMMF